MTHRENAFNLPIRIAYRPPVALIQLMTFSHAGALLCLLMVSLAHWQIGMLIMLISINYYSFYRDYHKQSKAQPCPQLCLGRENEWSLIADDDALVMQLRNGALVHRLLLVLRFTSENGKSYCFYLNSKNVEANTLRRLRVRLLHGKTKDLRQNSFL